jgi:hypothetical protein
MATTRERKTKAMQHGGRGTTPKQAAGQKPRDERRAKEEEMAREIECKECEEHRHGGIPIGSDPRE